MGEKKKTTLNLFLLIFLVVALILIFSFNPVVAVDPQGANYSNEVTTTRGATEPQGHSAYAGNVTMLDVTGFSTTQYWQGYYGNVSGTIQLADSSGNALYNWSAANPTGEVYVVNKSSNVLWDNIACFDVASNGDNLENDFNVSDGAVDGLNETFNLNNHDGFVTAGTVFATGDCSNVKLYNNTGGGSFDEVLLTDGIDIVYTSILENNYIGFDGGTHDFEMIVLENGASGKATATNYYFYLELGS
jgi:hypothetical protein